jgi:transposase
MGAPPAGISEADWLTWPDGARTFILAQQEIEQLSAQLTAVATELASLRERIGCSSRNSSKLPSSDGPGCKPPERRKGSGRKRGGQPGHPGAGPELLPMERVYFVLDTGGPARMRFAAAASSRSLPPCGNRAGMSGSSWSRPGSPATAAG